MPSLQKSARSTQSDPPLSQRDLFTRLLRARPLFAAALSFLMGCILARTASPPRAILCCAIVLLAVLCALLRKKRILPALLVLAMLPLGALRFDLQWQALEPLPELKGASLSGRICEIPEWREADQRCICVLEDLTIDGTDVPGKLRLYLRSDLENDPALLAPAIGQEIACTATIRPGDPATNPGQFDFDAYLRLHGLRGYATAKIEDFRFSPAPCNLSDRQKLLREAIGARIDRLFPRNAAIARAFLIGDRSDLSAEERKSYSDSGAAHLLAISGMHISILAGALTLLLRRLMNRRRSFCIVLALLLMYAGLIGFTASLTRAILMFAIFSAAPILGRHADAPTNLAAAALLYLLIRPIAILDVGFVLSYGASAGIVLLTAPLRRLTRCEAYLRRKPGHGVSALLLHRPLRWILNMILTSLAAQLAILPAVVHAFGAQPLFSIAVNLIAVPLAMFAYGTAILGTLTGLVPMARLSDGLYTLLTACVRFFGNLPLSTLHIARFPAWLVFLCAVVCLLSSELSSLPSRMRKYLPLTILLATLISNGCAHLTTLGCSVVVLDAGQADCAVIRTGGKVYLVDAGDAYSPAADYISAMNYEIEAVFLSHPHTDHVAGLQAVLEVCTPKRIYISSNWDALETDEGIPEILDAAVSQGSELITICAGAEIRLSKESTLQVLSPEAGFSPASANENSLILRLDYGSCSALFTGDASASTVAGLSCDCDLLKVGHHGAAQSVSVQLLAELTPSVAILPVGENNYGHPAEETLKLLRAAGCRILRTDMSGAVTCQLHADGSIRLRTMRPLEVVDDLE
ncbi:MAG: DNA internalization-related competence protein ComEC/Rec2 [Aristaeellaceae bacterium]